MRRREQRGNVFQYAEERREEIVCVINKEFLSFRSLKEEEDFIDVTLSCEEQQYSAHKVVFPKNDKDNDDDIGINNK